MAAGVALLTVQAAGQGIRERLRDRFDFDGVRSTPAELPDAPAFDPKDYDRVRAETLPTEAEERWREIAWRPSLAEGLEHAGRTGQPVLLWLMNGHPAGCT